jgi:RecA/RadA recombinase
VASRLARVPQRAPPPLPNAKVVSTGSTLLDLAISGWVYTNGGIPPGIMVEMFGPPGAGKTVVMCEMAGNVQRAGGKVLFDDPEGRLNAQFASLFAFDVSRAAYGRPDTVTEMFKSIRAWRPISKGINAVFADSLAALSTDLEMKKGDKMGQRRAKEFSEQLRVTCRELVKRNLLLVCSNQVRSNPDAGKFGEKYATSGGLAIPHYSSLRLRFNRPMKTPREITVRGKEYVRVVGVHTKVDVYKSSVGQPHYSAPLHIVYDYGIDDVRANLEYVKEKVGGASYRVDDGHRLDQGLDRSIRMVEEGELEPRLRAYTAQVWREFESKFKVERPAKRRVW